MPLTAILSPFQCRARASPDAHRTGLSAYRADKTFSKLRLDGANAYRAGATNGDFRLNNIMAAPSYRYSGSEPSCAFGVVIMHQKNRINKWRLSKLRQAEEFVQAIPVRQQQGNFQVIAGRYLLTASIAVNKRATASTARRYNGFRLKQRFPDQVAARL